jgi:CPA2 family monovalent cation:H+ antiporter-2
VSASLAQIGEFSFILAGLGLGLGLLPTEARNLILAGSILSITLNPLFFAIIPFILRALRCSGVLMKWLERGSAAHPAPPSVSVSALGGHAVIVGHGRVGGAITPVLERETLPFVVIERDRQIYESLRLRGVAAVYGDASARGVLAIAGVEQARMLIIATPDGYQARRILEISRAANPVIETFVRTHSDQELRYLQTQQVGVVLMAERELARRLTEHVLRSFGVPPARAALLVAEEASTELAVRAERL